jgi:hypothetical protein
MLVMRKTKREIVVTVTVMAARAGCDLSWKMSRLRGISAYAP